MIRTEPAHNRLAYATGDSILPDYYPVAQANPALHFNTVFATATQMPGLLTGNGKWGADLPLSVPFFV